jgi:hypothetical protein
MYDSWYLNNLDSADDRYTSEHLVHVFEIERTSRELRTGIIQEDQIGDWLHAEGKDLFLQGLLVISPYASV